MRVLFALPVIALPVVALVASACTTPPSGGASLGYQDELNTLEQQCRDRGGMLRPRVGYTAQPSRDYLCIIRDGPSERILDLEARR